MLTDHEALIRLSAFLSVFVGVACWEAVAPRRRRLVARSRRWPANLGIVAIDTVLVRLLLPAGAVGVAAAVAGRDWGLLPLLELPSWLAFALAVIALDLVVYLQHVAFHAVPALWRLHRMHHADLDFDVTTGSRFHPLEILLSMLLKMAAVAALGPPVAAVILFEVLLNATAMFNHGNAGLPPMLDRWVRWFIVTPDMHRVHHSWHPEETHSNFGFNLPWWDRVFGTYRDQPRDGHQAMTLGLPEFRDPVELRLHRLLLQPWRAVASGPAAGWRAGPD